MSDQIFDSEHHILQTLKKPGPFHKVGTQAHTQFLEYLLPTIIGSAFLAYVWYGLDRNRYALVDNRGPFLTSYFLRTTLIFVLILFVTMTTKYILDFILYRQAIENFEFAIQCLEKEGWSFNRSRSKATAPSGTTWYSEWAGARNAYDMFAYKWSVVN